jgi:hypothetical protein
VPRREQRAGTGEQLADAEGFRQIVVGAAIETKDFV